MPKTTSRFQQVMLKKASSASRGHLPFGTARLWPPARSAANSTRDPSPRHSARKVRGVTPESATFIAVQLKPQASVRPASSHHSWRGRCSCCPTSEDFKASRCKEVLTSNHIIRHVRGFLKYRCLIPTLPCSPSRD